ncbi:MAG: HD domain-containing protein [Bacteroidales bacterium]|nr:HD domain-containing protein [Bacteroidales bacterium]
MEKTISELFPKLDAEAALLVANAAGFAEATLEGRTRGNGKPFFEHPLHVARIACDEIGLPAECLAAVFIHEAMSQGGAEMPAGLPKDVMTLVEGLNRISTIKPKDTRLEAENYKKLIVSYSTDPRVVVLKLADRLEVMRSLELFPKSSRESKLLESLMLYIPLAHQLGLYNMKSEMEDIYFKYAEPEAYRLITNKLKASERDRIKITEQFIEPLETKLRDAGIAYKVKARTKTAWSIWKKMQKQKVDFDGVYDVFAMRFIIHPSECAPLIGDDGEMLEGLAYEHALCWKVFSFVTEKYESDTNRLRDWISNPKPNGYESLHITVRNSDGAYLEVQIRTDRMDAEAEAGLASHWSYKGIKREASLDNWLTAVRTALEGGATLHTDEDELPTPPSKEVFVFTPTGELRKLSAGATLLDFAFDIHTNLGSKCTGGRINGKAVSFREKLSTGDVVEIMQSKNQKPTADWLNICVTSKARTKIRQKLKEMEFAKAAEGKELLERRLKNWKMEISDEEIAELLKKWSYKTTRAFYEAIGDETLDVYVVRDAVLAMRNISTEESDAATHERIEEQKAREEAASARKSKDDILVIDARNVRGLDYKMAKCCNPVYGDEVFGFVSRLDGVKIHRMSCPNAARLIEQYPYRIQKVRWSENASTSSFQTTLRISAANDTSAIADIMNVVGSFRASVRNLTVNANPRNSTFDIVLKISVSGNLELDKVLSQLKIQKSILKVSRS